MKLSPSQVQRFWREWAITCKAMHWTRENGMTGAAIDAKRKELLAQCGFRSLTEVDRVDGFTKVLKEMQVLQGDDLNAGIEADNLNINKGRTIRHHILIELVPCLELYRVDVTQYIQSIAEDKMRWWKIDRPIREITLLDIPVNPIKTRDGRTIPSPLEQIRFTLQARLNKMRKEAGDTIHEMKMKAGVPCSCAVCASRIVKFGDALPASNEPVLTEDPY